MSELNIHTKDYVAKYYNYMIVHNLLNEYDLDLAVTEAVMKLNTGGTDVHKFIKKFIERIDEVKEIWEEQPKYCIEIEYDLWDPKLEEPERIKTEEFVNTYDEEILKDKLELIKHKHRASNVVINHYKIN